MHASDSESAAVLYGPPGSGKTSMMTQLIRTQPVVASAESPCIINIVVCHYTAFTDWRQHLEFEPDDNLVTVHTRMDFSKIDPMFNGCVSILCTDRHISHVLDLLRGTCIQRLVIDTPELLATGFTPVTTAKIRWFLTNDMRIPSQRFRPRCRSSIISLTLETRIVSFEAHDISPATTPVVYRETKNTLQQ